MAEQLKRLGATQVVSDMDTQLYLGEAGKNVSISSILVVNRGDTARIFRIAHIDGALAAVALEDYLAYDFEIAPRTAIPFTIGVCMLGAETILVRADHADVHFIAWGSVNQ